MNPTPLLCECDDIDCFSLLLINDDTYVAVKQRYPQSAVVLPNHEDPDDEILERTLAYLVVKDE